MKFLLAVLALSTASAYAAPQADQAQPSQPKVECEHNIYGEGPVCEGDPSSPRPLPSDYLPGKGICTPSFWEGITCE